ncbi:MAG TPA: ABC transporter permease [Pilimelia sp.]|nr:ABC transporter permease [Pilimelia sp.]
MTDAVPPRVSTGRRRVAAVALRHAAVLRRSPNRYFEIAVLPAVDTLLYASIATYMSASSGGTRTVLTVVTGMVFWHVIHQAQIAVSTGFFEEVYSRQLPSLFATPLRPVEWILGTALQGMVRIVVGVAAVACTATFAYGFDLTGAGAGLVPVFVLLLLTGWSFALVVVGLVLRFGSGTEALTWGMLSLILPLSGALYPIDVLPGFIQPVSRLLPTTYTFDAARAVAAGGPTPWGALGGAALATLALMATAVVFATLALRRFQRRGFISRYQ